MSATAKHFELKTVNGVLLVRFMVERFDSTNIDEISAELKDLIEPNCRIVLNLHNVKYMFSESLGQLVAFNSRVKLKNGKLRLCALHPDTYEIFKITQLTRVFDIYEDESSALEEFLATNGAP
jgi:anti-anti-sigma factor